MFSKEIPLDEDNIFSANLTDNNEVEQIRFNKSKLYAISGLLINQTIDANLSLPNVEGKKGFRYFKKICGRRKINLDLKIYNENFLDVTVPFKKRTDVLIDWILQSRKNGKPLNFTIIMIIFKRFGFILEYTPMEFTYEI